MLIPNYIRNSEKISHKHLLNYIHYALFSRLKILTKFDVIFLNNSSKYLSLPSLN